MAVRKSMCRSFITFGREMSKADSWIDARSAPTVVTDRTTHSYPFSFLG